MLASTNFITWKNDDQMAFLAVLSGLIAIILRNAFFNIIFYIYPYLHILLLFWVPLHSQTFCFSQRFFFECIINFLPRPSKSPKSSSSSHLTPILSICAFVEWLEPNCGAMYLITLSWGPLITSPLAVKSVYYRRLTAWTASIIFRFYISHSAFTRALACARAIKCIVHLKCNV